MTPAATDLETLGRHREIWAVRPELRAVYHEWFGQLLEQVRELTPVVEVGAGPGFFKEFAPHLISTDILPNPWVDISCDASSLPFRTESVGALVMVDTLHHLPAPVEFIGEAIRVLQPGGRLAMLEPWITPCSYLLYRFLHDEECRLGVNLAHPFDDVSKRAFDGNAAIPLALLKHFKARPYPLTLIRAETFVGLPYLLTFGFKRSRPVPGALVGVARALERLTAPVRKLAATRIVAVFEKPAPGPSA
jgi:SAM-dependent methyltransferase